MRAIRKPGAVFDPTRYEVPIPTVHSGDVPIKVP